MRPYMNTGNARILPIDRFDPSLVLYLPLWYPHADMTGSTIYSYDKNRHAVTVTGATWGYQGRTFNGTTDLITVTDAAVIQNLTSITIRAWGYPTDSGEGNTGGIVWKSNNMQFGFYDVGAFEFLRGRATDADAYTKTNYITLGAWHHLVGTYESTAIHLYNNGAEVDYTGGGGQTAGLGNLDSDAGNLIIGNRAAADRTWKGLIGELCVYNRVLSPGEVMRDYQATKWRYT